MPLEPSLRMKLVTLVDLADSVCSVRLFTKQSLTSSRTR